MDHDKTEACPFTRERDKPSLDLGEALYIGTMDNLRKPALVLRPHPPPPLSFKCYLDQNPRFRHTILRIACG